MVNYGYVFWPEAVTINMSLTPDPWISSTGQLQGSSSKHEPFTTFAFVTLALQTAGLQAACVHDDDLHIRQSSPGVSSGLLAGSVTNSSRHEFDDW